MTPEAKLKRFTRSLQFSILGTTVLAVLFFFNFEAERQIDRANELRQLSFQLVDELHTSSDELTRMVRTYVLTRDPRFKTYYQDILDIRDGRKPMPKGYESGVYWDVISAGKSPLHVGFQPAVPLLEKMRLAKFSPEELALLAKSKANSEALTKTEFEAMRLVEQAGNNVILRERAEQMLYDSAYHQAKLSIMAPIDEFTELMDKRTKAAVKYAEFTVYLFSTFLVLYGIGLFFLFRQTYIALMRVIGGTPDVVHAEITKIGVGDFNSPIHVAKGMEGSVLAWIEEARKQLGILSKERLENLNRIQRLSDFYAALRQSNQAIVRSSNTDELFPTLCRDAVEFGKMKMAWVGMLDNESKLIHPVSSFGEGVNYLEDIQISIDADLPVGRGPCGIAVRDNTSVWIQDFQHDPIVAMWQERATHYDWGASATLPLTCDGKVVGVFNIYTAEKNTFDEAVRALLEEMASDISFALTSFKRESERKQAESQLAIAGKVFDQSSEGFIVADVERNIISVNRAFSQITGYSESEVIGKNPRILSSGHQDQAFYKIMWDSINSSGIWEGEVWNRRKDGSLYPEWLTISSAYDSDGKVTEYIGTLRDITQQKKSESEIARLVHYDALTGLPNITLLKDRAERAFSSALRNNTQVALFFLDLDNFKNINDSMGHSTGDELLIEVAKRMRTLVRDEDTVARLGGDEFVLILSDIEPDSAAQVAEKLKVSIAKHYKIEGAEFKVTPSIGIAMFPSDGKTFDELAKCADIAMYRAKQEGRNSFRFFTAEMQTKSARVLAIDHALHSAMELGQLSLHYQPQISTASGKIVGAEALLRWNHPEWGMLSPAEFIPIAEAGGQIIPIGAWVMRTAAQQLRSWVDAGIKPFTMAINLSAVQFRQPSLPDLVMNILIESQLPPSWFELELTESVAMDDPLAAIVVMNELHDRGIRIAIDDFGTGYSSLSYLKRFQVNKLKIDQSFVRDLLVDAEDKAIVSAIISLASSLGIGTIAEGVETPEQLAFLRTQGCSEVQGYYFSKPLPAEQFEMYMRQYITV